jgi:hypothetical protein
MHKKMTVATYLIRTQKRSAAKQTVKRRKQKKRDEQQNQAAVPSPAALHTL